ncbi:MAG: methionine--tRNA ligase [Nanoarchaeota archaeon]
MVKKKFYVTTPIYYPSGKPHIGSVYTTIAADVLSRWYKLLGYEVFFLTGTDEHTKKVLVEADKNGKNVNNYLDEITKVFKKTFESLDINYDRFIRTSDEDHKKFVQYILNVINKKGDIYKGKYEGYYCNECEDYYTEREASKLICPIHGKNLEFLKEDSYFFKLSKYKDKLLDFYEKNPNFISPEYRRSEIINRVKEGLRDLSISRKDLNWGIEIPFDKEHRVYVWFDALNNYLTGVGVLNDKKLFKKFWPADLHIVGKDILWFHSVIWPAILISAGYKIPKKIYAHGWLTSNDKKIGKSLGNADDIEELIKKYGSDSIRYFLFKVIPFGEDGEYSEKNLIERNNELANKLGNLVSRVSSLVEKKGIEKSKNKLFKKSYLKKISWLIENLEFDKALNEIFAFVDICNEYIQKKKPWDTGDPENSLEFSGLQKIQNEKRLSEARKVLYELADSIKIIAILLWPFIPNTCEKIAKNFSFKIDYSEINKTISVKKIRKEENLFKRV